MATNIPRSRHGNAAYRNTNVRGQGHGNDGHGNNGHGNNGQDGGGYGFRTITTKEQLYEILHVLFKRKRLVALLFLAIALPGTLAVVLRKPSYVATAKVNISTDRANLTIQPSDLTELSLVRLNESIVNSEVHVIRSINMLENVVRGLAVANAEGGVVGLANAAGSEGELGARALRLQNELQVTPVRASNVIQIDYTSNDQKRAAEVIQRVLEEYIAYNAQVHGQRGLTDFYEEQSRLLQQSLERSEATLRDFALREGVIVPTVELQGEINTINQMDKDLRQLSAAEVGAEERLRVVRDQLAEQPALVKRAQYLDVNPVVRQLTDHLIARKMDQVALLRKYTDKDRHVTDAAEEIAAIQSQLEETMRDQPTVVSKQVFHSNPVYDTRLTALLDLEANLKEYRARKMAMQEDLDRSQKRLASLKLSSVEFERLEQDVKRRREMLDLYEKRGQEARISEAMDQKQLVNVEVVQRPSLPLPQKSEPQAPLILAILSGLCVSLGGTFGVEYLNRTLRFERDVEQQLGLPVLGVMRDVEET